jgi:hypothetical protein
MFDSRRGLCCGRRKILLSLSNARIKLNKPTFKWLQANKRSWHIDEWVWHCCTLSYHALLLLPSRCAVFLWPFIFFVEKLRKSALDIASPLFENRFFPPNPNFSSFFCRLSRVRPALLSLPPRDGLSALLASSNATSNNSSSFAPPVSPSFRSADRIVSNTQVPKIREIKTYFALVN